ncbi:SAM-dependent DNA methyltransferase, partial [Candidatus Poribacteria bacterium]|nr:SAM-dependent DNA methyltransferase [Candidatus Poribacteria bacterium]
METPIGQVFTPTEWAEWLINKWNIFDAWMDGAEICDPTAGQGAFIIALLNIARNQG